MLDHLHASFQDALLLFFICFFKYFLLVSIEELPLELLALLQLGTNVRVQDHDQDKDNNKTNGPKQNSNTTSEQPTLQALAKANLKDLGGMEDSNGTFAHGHFHQNPKGLLSVTISLQKEEPKVEHPLENSDRNQNLHTIDQPTLMGLCRAQSDELQDMEGRDGISTLGTLHQAIGSPFSSTERQLDNG